MHFGYAPTQTITRAPVTHPATAPALAVPSAVRPGTLVTYAGSRIEDHGSWIYGGPCPCGCSGLKLWRRKADGLHQLVHVSVFSVARGRLS